MDLVCFHSFLTGLSNLVYLFLIENIVLGSIFFNDYFELLMLIDGELFRDLQRHILATPVQGS